ncbi:MAG: hypothetical protein FJZ58_04650 [Chlamydiae bacterium]|jgi:hypothetical protein|nr:hypothetical protein [Chlamydiota bacterium]
MSINFSSLLAQGQQFFQQGVAQCQGAASYFSSLPTSEYGKVAMQHAHYLWVASEAYNLSQDLEGFQQINWVNLGQELGLSRLCGETCGKKKNSYMMDVLCLVKIAAKVCIIGGILLQAPNILITGLALRGLEKSIIVLSQVLLNNSLSIELKIGIVVYSIAECALYYGILAHDPLYVAGALASRLFCHLHFERAVTFQRAANVAFNLVSLWILTPEVFACL